MVTCRNCAASIESKWNFCIYCGTPVAAAALAVEATPDESSDPNASPWKLSPIFVLGMIFVAIGLALLATFIALRG